MQLKIVYFILHQLNMQLMNKYEMKRKAIFYNLQLYIFIFIL